MIKSENPVGDNNSRVNKSESSINNEGGETDFLIQTGTDTEGEEEEEESDSEISQN